ncbi:MAG: prepilin-type N-terminal cleavage/methylation domain-containing protein [Candidatus Saccharimonadales bacterium]
MNSNQKGFSVVEILIVIIVIGLLGAVGWLVYDRQKSKTSETQTNTQQKEETPKQETEQTEQKLINTGWKVYTSEKLNLSFEYPESWTVKEEDQISSGSRIYISSHSGEYNKGNIPSGYQNIWLSTWDQEVSAEDENSVKSGSPKCCEAGPVTPSSIQAGSIKINAYEYQTVGGPKLQAYWTSNGKRYYATNATEIGNQNSMVDTLKKLLPTVKHL